MTHSSKIDYKPFARVWRRYENALSRIHAPCFIETYKDGEWRCALELGRNPEFPPLIEAEVVPPEQVKPWMKPNPYDEDGIIRIDRNSELDAQEEVDDAGAEWAEMLLPLENIRTDSIPRSFNGSALREMRSAVYALCREQDN